MLSSLRAHLPAWRRALRRRRRPLMLLVLVALLVAVLPAVVPPSARGVAVTVAATDLPPGTELTAQHLDTVRIAPQLAPEEPALDPSALIGAELIAPVPAGAQLLHGHLRSDDAPPAPPGTSLLAIPAPAVLAAHLHPGAEVEILTSGGERPRPVGAQVVEVQDAEAPVIGGATPDGLVLLVAVQRSAASDVARASAEGWLTVSVIG